MRYNQPYGLPDAPSIPSPNPPDGSAFQRYVNGNPVTGTAGSIPPAGSIDEDQIEILNVIIASGLIPTHGDLTQLLQALNIMFAQRFITTHLDKTVHGSGADFPDLHAALEWLARYVITQTGSVTFHIAGGPSSGICQSWVYTQEVVIDHPNANRVVITGAPLWGAAPISTDFRYTGFSSTNRQSDAQYDLNNILRTRYSSELIFQGGSPAGSHPNGFVIKSRGVMIQDLLISSDQGFAGDRNSANGIYAQADFNADTIAIWGFGQYGMLIDNAWFEYDAGVGHDLCLVWNQGGGLVMWYGQIGHTSDIVLASNGGNGMSLFNAGISNTPSNQLRKVYARCNAGAGINMVGGSLFQESTQSGTPGCTIYQNGGDGIDSDGACSIYISEAAVEMNFNYGVRMFNGYMRCYLADFGNNNQSATLGVSGIYASDGAVVDAGNATSAATNLNGNCSPAVNVYNTNNDSFIYWSATLREAEELPPPPPVDEKALKIRE